MKKYLIAMLMGASLCTDAPACAPERPTHNAYMFSVFRRERMQSPFAQDMNKWWKAYADNLRSDDPEYYKNNTDTLRAIAESKGDKGMLDYMRLLDGYLRVSDAMSMDA